MRVLFLKVVPLIVASAAIIVFGVFSGYVLSEMLPATSSKSYIGPITSSQSPSPELPRKTPIPNDMPPLIAATLDYRTESFIVRTDPNLPVRITVRAPTRWTLSANRAEPQQVRFLDPTNERSLRVESGFTPDRSTSVAMAVHLGKLVDSQPPGNDLRIQSQRTGTVVGTDGESRAVSTLVYTYIPNKTVRYVMIRWIAIGGERAVVEMSATGLPQDAKALTAVLEEATRSVRRTD